VPSRDPCHALGLIFETAGIEPRRGSKGFGPLGELTCGVPGIDPIDWTDRSKVAIGEIIGAARLKAASKRRERGRARARTQD
jgi:hypothetical protein